MLAVAAIWFSKTTSLPKIYYKISNKRGIPVSTLRAFEKQGHKLVKLRLDVKYLEACLDLNLCLEFLKFKPPNLNVYGDGTNRELFKVVVKEKVKEVDRIKKAAEVRFNNLKKIILSQLSFMERTCLISLLNKKFKRAATPHILTHERKLSICR